MREAGWQMGSPLSPEVIEKAKAKAPDKGLAADDVAQFLTRMAQRMAGGGGGGGGRRSGGSGGAGERAANSVVTTRALYKIADAAAKDKSLEAVAVRLGISDGFYTEVLGGLAEGDTSVTSVIMPGAAAPILQAPGGSQNPFQSRGGPPGMGGMPGGRGR
jgi:hypothetical protein